MGEGGGEVGRISESCVREGSGVERRGQVREAELCAGFSLSLFGDSFVLRS